MSADTHLLHDNFAQGSTMLEACEVTFPNEVFKSDTVTYRSFEIFI